VYGSVLDSVRILDVMHRATTSAFTQYAFKAIVAMRLHGC
jgi:hypothetical protein